CLECHAEEACRAPREKRLANGLNDDCLACHMPRGPTDIPHFAFTHHRIGLHSADEPEPPATEPGTLVLLSPHNDLPQGDQTRNLALAWLQLSDGPGQGAFAESHREKARELLESLDPSIADAETEAALARLWWGVDPARTERHARNVF